MSHTVQTSISGSTLSIETGKVAKQADGAVVVRCGGTMVLSTVVATKTALEGRDFLPELGKPSRGHLAAVDFGPHLHEGRLTGFDVGVCRTGVVVPEGEHAGHANDYEHTYLRIPRQLVKTEVDCHIRFSVSGPL